MPSQGEVCKSSDCASNPLTRQFYESILKCLLHVRQCASVAQFPQRLFSYMSQEISGVKRRIALAVQIKINNPQAIAIDEDLGGIKVPVNAAGLRNWAVFA